MIRCVFFLDYQHLDSVKEMDIESRAQSFVNILVYYEFKNLGLMVREMETEVDIVSCCWEINLLAAFNDVGANVVEI